MIKDKSVNIGEARANFSELIKRAASGEEIIISKAGEPQAKLIAAKPLEKRPENLLAHLFTEEQLDALDQAIEDSIDKEEDWSEFYADINLGG